MRNYLFFIISLFFLINIGAQDRPTFLPEDIGAPTFDNQCLCQPGVVNKSKSKGLELSYNQLGSSLFQQEDAFTLSKPFSEQSLQKLTFKLRFPIVIKEGLKIIGGLYYAPERYQFQKIGAEYQAVFKHLDGKALKSSGFELLLNKSWNEKNYTSLRFRTLFNGDYNGLIDFQQKYAIYNVSALFGIKKTTDKEWGFGLSLSHSFRSTIVLPFVLYNHTFNEKWGIESILPALIKFRYNHSKKLLFLGGIRYNSRSYRLDTEEQDHSIYHLNHSEIQFTLTAENQLSKWVWVECTLGLQHSFSTDFDAPENDNFSFQVEPGMSPFFKIGIFVSPPDSMKKK